MSDLWIHKYKKRIIIGLILMQAIGIGGAILLTVTLTRESVMRESANNTRLFAKAITAALKQSMLNRSSSHIQETLLSVGRSEQISKVTIINKGGVVIYSTDKQEIGKSFAKTSDSFCRACHTDRGTIAGKTPVILPTDDGEILRDIIPVFNEPSCYHCHPETEKINGKLIIDRPLTPIYALVSRIATIIFVAGGICLLLLIPFLSRMINRYIDQIAQNNTEINLVYSIIKSVSKTIDMEELKHIVLDIVCDALSAKEADLVLPNGQHGYRVVTRQHNGEKIHRKKLEPDNPMMETVLKWVDGEVTTHAFSNNKEEFYMPITKGEHRHALIAVRFPDGKFPMDKIPLVDAICNHIAIAFENARLYEIAITDELTGIYSIRHFRYCIDRQMTHFERYNEKFTLLAIDIDKFKNVNDIYGHPFGDTVLKSVAACIIESIRGTDYAFRCGGEEFSVILPGTVLPGALQVAERIRTQIEAMEICEEDFIYSVTVSIGLSVFPDNASTTKGLISESDKALYTAKKSGRNQTVISKNHGDDI